MKLDAEARYSESHEWVRPEEEEFVCGITDHAQQSLSDVVYVELPEVGEEFESGDVFGVVESVKAASDIYMAMSGSISAVNEELEDTPEMVNQDPYGQGWMIRFVASDPADFDQLLDAGAYEQLVAEEEG
jgi:glycine cleavage system H protein